MDDDAKALGADGCGLCHSLDLVVAGHQRPACIYAGAEAAVCRHGHVTDHSRCPRPAMGQLVGSHQHPAYSNVIIAIDERGMAWRRNIMWETEWAPLWPHDVGGRSSVKDL